MLVRTKYEFMYEHTACKHAVPDLCVCVCVCVCAVMLGAPDDVLLERSRGKLVDPLTGGQSGFFCDVSL